MVGICVWSEYRRALLGKWDGVEWIALALSKTNKRLAQTVRYSSTLSIILNPLKETCYPVLNWCNEAFYNRIYLIDYSTPRTAEKGGGIDTNQRIQV